MIPTPMSRCLKRWLSILLLGALAFSQASLVLAACAMDRGDLHSMLSVDDEHDCCDEASAATGGEAMTMSANACVAHSTSDLQAAGSPLIVLPAPLLSAHFVVPPPPVSSYRGNRDDSPPGVVPRRILLHSFLI